MEVDKDLYTLKLTARGKKTIGKVNKGINVEKKCNGFKKLKIKIIKKRKEKRQKTIEKRGKKKRKENSMELQKPTLEAQVYNNNIQCD